MEFDLCRIEAPCIACCVGDYIHRPKEELDQIFRQRYKLRLENTLDYFLQASIHDPHMSCPYVGYITEEEVGCLIHPLILGFEIRPSLSRPICRDFSCPAADYFSSLPEEGKDLVIRNLKGLDWYSKSCMIAEDFHNLFK